MDTPSSPQCEQPSFKAEIHVQAAPGHCSFQTAVWLWSFGAGIQHIPSPT